MIQPLGRALARQFLVLAQKGRQLQLFQMMLEQDARRLSHGRRPAGWTFMRQQKSRCDARYVSIMSCLLWFARSAARLAGSERFSHGSHDRADAQLLSGRFPAPMRRIRPPIPLAAGTAFRRRDPSTGRCLSALSMVGHSPPGPAPAASGRTGTVRSQDQASLAPVGTRPVSQNRQRAMSSLRASATTITRRIRPRPPAVRSSNRLLSALSG